MNVTKHGNEDRQLNKGYPTKVSAEQKGHSEASTPARIAENNDFIMGFQTDRLMEWILHRDNMNNAYRRVKANKGVGGIDKTPIK